jgi:hypothetical protein
MKILKVYLDTAIRFRLIFLVMASLSILFLLSACGSSPTPVVTADQDSSNSQLSAEIQQAPPSVVEAYQFAISNPDDLKNVPCYCGCKAMGHTSNYDCYIDEIKPSGEVIYDGHALGCSICVDISQDVMRLTREGKSPEAIRTAIDQTYAQYGPSNFPPGK